MKRFFLIAIVFLASATIVFSQADKPVLAVFGAVSKSNDVSTIKMSQDYFFQQVSTMSSFTVVDRRSDKYEKESNFENISFAFYPEIQEQNSGWNCTFYVVNLANGEKTTDNKQYESYYKILMDSKSAIQDLLSNALAKSKQQSLNASFATNTIQTSKDVNIESLSGTWKAEDFIDKVIILRGGKGFIIYKNGATMNISIKVDENTVVATQISKPNASYFPDIPRNVALELALTAKPIEYRLKMTETNTLAGEKITAKYDNDNITEGAVIPVVWNKQN